MQYVYEILGQMLNSGIAIPALMMGYYLTFHRFSTVILPLVVYGVIDHILVKLLYIVELQQNTFVQLGSKITQLDWIGIMLKDSWQDIAAFFILSFAVFSLCKLVKKLKS